MSPALLVCGALVLSGLAGVLLFGRFHSGTAGPVVYLSDMLNYYYPMTERVSARLAGGEWPLWNPSNCMGIPLLATLQVGALYPGIWLSVWFGPQDGMYWLLAIECGIGAAMATWACSAGGRGPGASVLGGLIFGFSVLVGSSWWPSHTATLCWMPGVIVGIEKLTRSAGSPGLGGRPGRMSGWSCIAIFTALQCLAGFPQYLVYSFLFAGPYAAVRLGSQWHGAGLREGLRPTLLCGTLMTSAVVVGVGIAAAEMLPGLELAGEGVRTGNLSAREVGYLTGAPNLQRFFSNALNPTPKLIILDFGPGGGYVGIATLALAALGAVARWRRPETWFLLIAGPTFLLLSSGYAHGSREIYEVFTRLPVVGLFRTPERLRFIWFFCVLVLASDGFAVFADGYRRLREQRITAALALAAASLVLLWVTAGGAPGALLRAVACALLLAAAWPLASQLGARALLQVAMLALIFADLWFAISPQGMLPLRDHQIHGSYSFSRQILGPADFARLKRRAGTNRVEFTGFIPRLSVGEAKRLHQMTCYDPMVPARWQELANVLNSSAVLGSSRAFDHEQYPTLYDVASVKLAVASSKAREPTITVNLDALPRAYVVEQYEIADRGIAFERIRDGDFDFRRRVMLEYHPDVPGWRPSANPPEARPAKIVRYVDESVEIQAATSSHALLVLTDAIYPGWVARIDGEPTEILSANGIFRAVHLPPGRHTVTFDYEPQSFSWGLRISAVSFALWLGVAVVGVVITHRRA